MLMIVRHLGGAQSTSKAASAVAATHLPEQLADLLDRAATEEQRLTWKTLQQYAAANALPLELLVARAWGARFPFVELLAAGMPQRVLGGYERRWSRLSSARQTRCLAEAFAYAAVCQRRQQILRQD